MPPVSRLSYYRPPWLPRSCCGPLQLFVFLKRCLLEFQLIKIGVLVVFDAYLAVCPPVDFSVGIPAFVFVQTIPLYDPANDRIAFNALVAHPGRIILLRGLPFFRLIGRAVAMGFPIKINDFYAFMGLAANAGILVLKASPHRQVYFFDMLSRRSAAGGSRYEADNVQVGEVTAAAAATTTATVSSEIVLFGDREISLDFLLHVAGPFFQFRLVETVEKCLPRKNHLADFVELLRLTTFVVV